MWHLLQQGNVANRTPPARRKLQLWCVLSTFAPTVCLGLFLSAALNGVTARHITQSKVVQLQTKAERLNGGKTQGLLQSKIHLIQPNTTRNVTTQIGRTVYLHCIVDSLEEKTTQNPTKVTWIRLRDFHLLTVGIYSYTTDGRFQTAHNQYSKDWALQIQYPQLQDEGLYECHINSEPPVSHYVYLRVVVPKSKIVGGSDMFVKVGSNLTLTCIITQSTEPPAHVFWYHNDKMINYDLPRGKITLMKAEDDTAVSRLHIAVTETNDSGNYTCCPLNADASSIMVHVLRGEKHAAVQNDASLLPASAETVSSSTNRHRILIVTLVTVHSLLWR